MAFSKKLFSFLLMFVLLLSAASPTLASDYSSRDNSEPSEETVVKSFLVKDNRIVELSAEELAELKAFAKKENEQKEFFKKNLSLSRSLINNAELNSHGLITPMAPPFCGTSCTWAEYDEYNRVQTLVPSKKKRVTPAVRSGKVTYTASGTFEKSINITLTGPISKALEATLGVGWAHTSSVGIELEVEAPDGKYAWFDFTPTMYNSYGWTATYENSYYTGFKDKQISKEWTDIYMAKLVGNWQDGVYELVTSSNPPTY